MIYTFLGLTIANVGLYYLYYSFSIIFPVQEQVFSFRLIGLDNYPLWGFGILILSAFLGSLCVFASTKTNPFKGVALIFLGITFSLSLTTTVMPFSITVSVAYIALGGVVSAIRVVEPSDELIHRMITTSRKIPIYDLIHHRFLTLMSYSIWAIITVIVSGVSALLLNPAAKIMVERGGMHWKFFEGQAIICFVLIAYYAIGFLYMVTFQAYQKLKEIEELALNQGTTNNYHQ